ncbi:hypothetical protein KGM_207103 [Danaus plexippus plexippus]|uniref:Uncharacterized protein n=1 Tax=Danaus plexippus plexippus TaxID=278856 RepID=A0A212FMX5_DANPL|nr:hypothetical protein KGM_207103 [Danaus plexippus plexippus]
MCGGGGGPTRHSTNEKRTRGDRWSVVEDTDRPRHMN